MAIAQVTIVPLGTASTSLGHYVADVIEVLKQTDEEIKYELTPMSTIVEGDIEALIRVIRRLHEVPFEHGALRVSTSITIDDRRDKTGTMDQKMRSVKEKLMD